MDFFLSPIGVAIYTVAAFGLAYVVGHSKVSLPAREFLADIGEDARVAPAVGLVARVTLALVECPACYGFWTGLLAGALVSFRAALVAAFYTCGSNFILGRMTRLIPE